MTDKESIKLDIISAYIGSPLTEEQKEFASNFGLDTVSFSDPGVGKTHTLTAGLVMAQDFHKIPGSLINCMSFTNAAVGEMAGRYEKLCKKCSITPSVVFNTFHSLSRKILRESYPGIRISDGNNNKEDVEDMISYLRGVGIEVDEEDKRFPRKVLKAINNLNSALIFHPDNVAIQYEFVELQMDIEIFQSLRKTWFLRGLTRNCINQGDIPLYCLYSLMSKPAIIEKWKGRYKIMVVDEFQDLSLLHLRILSYIAETLVVIGDMKQQIYAFNGACPQIVREYMKLRPNARVCNITKSWRCGQEIAEFATRIIKPNDESVHCFTGHSRGSSVEIVPRKNIDWSEIAKNIEHDKLAHGHNTVDVMFLYRNNASVIPIIEELYKRGIPFRCSRYTPIMEVPMFESMSKLCTAAWQPNDANLVAKALRLFPEFRDSLFGDALPAPVQAMQASGKSIFELNYKYTEGSSYDLLNAMRAANLAIEANKSAGVVFMKVMEVYKKYIQKKEWWKLENSEEYYLNLVAPICNSKTYPIMYNEEMDKGMRNLDCIKAGTGVRCYTMHSAKGLEADEVYILDCDEGTFPNAKVMKEKIAAGCNYSVAVDIRSERNLLYVAATRAKNRLVITYSGSEPTKLITDPYCETYHKFDVIYEQEFREYDDAAEFFKLFRLNEV